MTYCGFRPPSQDSNKVLYSSVLLFQATSSVILGFPLPIITFSNALLSLLRATSKFLSADSNLFSQVLCRFYQANESSAEDFIAIWQVSQR